MKLSEIRKEAMEALTGKWKKALVIAAIYLVVTFGISFITGLFEEGSIMGTILVVVEFVITIPLSFGLAWTFLKLKRNEIVKIFDFFKIGFCNFFRVWKITGKTLLKMIFPMFVFIINRELYDLIVSYSIMRAEAGEVLIGRLGGLAAFAIYYIPVLYIMFVLLKYSLTSFIAYDKLDMSATEVVKESEKLMKKNRWKIILAQLPYILWEILGSFLFLEKTSYIGIGVYLIGNMLIFTYVQVVTVCFYEKLALQD